MSDFCFIVAGSEDRDYLLKRCVESIQKSKYFDSDIYLYWQGDAEAIPYKDRFTGIIVSERLRGIFKPRYELFKACHNYDYVILIDDDLFLYPDTSYDTAMAFLRAINNTGICNLGRQFDKKRNELRKIDYSREDYNVCGGIVFPKRCVELIIDFFKDTDENVTEDIFWILLYVKGYDLYRDFSNKSLHTCHRTAKDGSNSGYYKMRLEKPHRPLLPQYTNARQVKDYFEGQMRWKVPETRDVNEAGLEERKRCRKEMGL